MGRRSWSQRDVERVVARLRGAMDLEQEITLSADECWLIIKGLERLAYNRR